MELTVEALTAAGVPEDTAKQVLEAHKAALQATVPKTQLDEAQKALTTAKTDLASRDKQLAELKPLADKGSELETKIAELEKQNKETTAKATKDMADYRKKVAIEAALQGKAQDAGIVASLIDADKVTVDEDGKVTGLTEQVTQLQKDKSFLFISEGGSGSSSPDFQPFGTPPPSGSAPLKGAGQPKPGDFGKKLAATAAATAATTKKSNDYYFGGNNNG